MLVSLSQKWWVNAGLVVLGGVIVGSLLLTLLVFRGTDEEPMLLDEQQEQQSVDERSTSVLLVSRTQAADDDVVAAIAESTSVKGVETSARSVGGDSFPPYAMSAESGDAFIAHLENWSQSRAQTCYNTVRMIYDRAVASGVSEDDPNMVFAADNLFVGKSAHQSLQNGSEQEVLSLISWTVKDLANAGVAVDGVDAGCLVSLG